MFDVGKKVWFVNTDRPGVKLFLVSEEIVKKSLGGETREYVFQGTHQSKSREFLSKNLTGEFFSDKEEAFAFMHAQAAEAIHRMLDSASGHYNQVYGQPELSPVEPQIEVQEPIVADTGEDIIVELPDGTKARMKGGINAKNLN
tara:strand:- start:1223 stop:1654 length:432 start_codon:yes stop_codon:yes gene_type:complete